ncbi:MAG: porin family protein [Reichenbachiella sp.]
MKALTICFLMVIHAAVGYTQDHEEHSESTEQELDHKHTIIMGMGHTHIPNASDKGLVVPSWSLSYHYWFNEKWAVSVSNEIEIATYAIETPDNLEIERERPYILAVGPLFRPFPFLVVNVALGREFEKHESFWVYRLGAVYEIFATDKWDAGVEFAYDIKEDVFNTWTIGLGVGRKF